MAKKNVRNLQFVGIDDWARPVYKEIDGTRVYKDLNLGNGTPDLYRALDDEFDGEPDYPFKASEYIIVEERKNSPFKFDYQMLDRLRTDCIYYLGYGNRNPQNLWGITVVGHISEMKQRWNNLPDDAKPEWLTWEQILDYEKKMTGVV